MYIDAAAWVNAAKMRGFIEARNLNVTSFQVVEIVKMKSLEGMMLLDAAYGKGQKMRWERIM